MQNENLIKGQFIELLVQAELVRYGFDISIPTYNSAKYDILADTGVEMLKIQVKKSISMSKNSFTFVCTTQNVRSSSNSAKHKYTSEEIDYFATAWNDNVYLIPVDEASTQKTIQIDDKSYLAENILSMYPRIANDEIFNQSQSLENKIYCEDCGIEIYKESNKCKICSGISQRKTDRPDRETLKNLIRNLSFTAIGQNYSVSDNAIRKWCDFYNLPRKKADIKKFSDERWIEV